MAGPHLLSEVVLYLRVAGQAWAGLYLVWALLTASWAIHLMVIGFCLCLFSYIRLPPPSPLVAQQVLGPPPSGPEDSETCWEVAHRAAGLDAPENSLEAVRLAASNGAKWVEFDVSFTSDGTAVAFHDDTLERVTTASGPIADTTFSQLGRLDLATRHPLAASFQGVRIPTVKAFVAEVLRLNMKLVIDLKTYQRPDETVALVRSLYQDLPALRTNALVTSFFPQLLYRLRAVDPDIVCSLSTRPYFVSSSTYDGTDEGLRPRFTGLQQAAARGLDLAWPWLLDSVIWWVVGISALLVHKSMVTRQFVLDWRRRGVRVMAWTVNSPLEKAVMRRLLGVQVLTDTLDRVPEDRWLPQL